MVWEVEEESGTVAGVHYLLFVPKPAAPAAPAAAAVIDNSASASNQSHRHGIVLLAHGFGGSPKDYATLARELCARAGLVVLVPKWLSVMGLTKAGRGARRAKCVKHFASHVGWLQERGRTTGDALFGRVDESSVALVGHSAGGAVVFEVAALLPEGVVGTLALLDGVPWVRTLDLARDTKLLADGSSSNLRCLNLRAPSSSFNEWDIGLELMVLATGEPSAPPTAVTDVLLQSARHGDFASDIGSNSCLSCVARQAGMLSKDRSANSLCIDVLTSFFVSEDAFAHVIAAAAPVVDVQTEHLTRDKIQKPRSISFFLY